MNVHVKCDVCSWHKQVAWDDVPKWHMVKCPDCGICTIVNDDDLQVWKQIEFVVTIDRVLKRVLGWFGIKPKTKFVTIDSSPLRRGEKNPSVQIHK